MDLHNYVFFQTLVKRSRCILLQWSIWDLLTRKEGRITLRTAERYSWWTFKDTFGHRGRLIGCISYYLSKADDRALLRDWTISKNQKKDQRFKRWSALNKEVIFSFPATVLWLLTKNYHSKKEEGMEGYQQQGYFAKGRIIIRRSAVLNLLRMRLVRFWKQAKEEGMQMMAICSVETISR